MFRQREGEPEVLLVHPGGPFWSHKDDGAWSLPKGELEAGEDPLTAARREFREETGIEVPGDVIRLTPARQRGGKVVYAWAVRGDCEPASLHSNVLALEWPRGSGRSQEFPEVDRAAWFDVQTARRKLVSGQVSFLDELQRILSSPGQDG